MLRVGVVVSTSAAIIALGIGATTASAALPEFLPGTKNSFTSKATTLTFEQKGGPAPVTCTASVGAGFVEGPKTGTLTEVYENCSAPLSGKCTGLGNGTVGDITVPATWQAGYIDKATKDIGFLFTLKPVHFECEKLISLVTLEGCVIGLVTPINSDVKEYIAKLKGAKGNQEFIEDEAAECKLESEISGGAKAQSSLNTEIKMTLSNLAELMA